MKLPKSAVSIALFVVTTASLATDPPAPGAVAAPQAPASATAVQAPAAATPAQPPAAATPATAPTGPTAVAAPDAAATAKAAHALGYSPKQRSGKLVYCKAEASVGTRLQSMKCFTEEEMTRGHPTQYPESGQPGEDSAHGAVSRG